MVKNGKLNLHFIFATIFILSFIVAIGSNWYRYYYTKNYDYFIEAACDPAVEQCFFRDCEGEPDLCPPNYLSHYKAFYVKAYDFPKCSDNSCAKECASGAINCTPIQCGEDPEDICEGN